MTKYVFVTGGVVSSLGKGITASSLALLLKNRGLKMFMQKLDPYLNIDPGTMSPYQHGEVFVTTDGAETDLDLGHYERFIDENLSGNSSVTAGKIYARVIEKERAGEYGGQTVQVIPHIVDEIKRRLQLVAKESGADVIITEIGGTVGDIESLPFLEAIRQARRDFDYKNTFFLHNTLMPYLKSTGEIKTKPTQHSVKALQSLGIQPDGLVLRTEVEIPADLKSKISLFCNVPEAGIVQAKDAKILYEVPIALQHQGLDDFVLDHFRVRANKAEMADWNALIETVRNLDGEIQIALVGKYVSLQDAYLSVAEALKHAGYSFSKRINIVWIDAEELSADNVKARLKDADGILVPGGFGHRGLEGKLLAIQYARENEVPFFGICLGMQLATIEFARNVGNLKAANSTEFDPKTAHPIIHILPDQYSGIDLGGTLRLGNHKCRIKENTKAHLAYGATDIEERHRHRYEFNNAYKKQLEDFGLRFSGINPEQNLVEIIEIPTHPWFVAGQFHPEFASRPEKPHPLFKSFIEAALKSNENK